MSNARQPGAKSWLKSTTSTSTICGDGCPLFHAPVLRPTSWPNARDHRDGEVN